MLLRFNFKKIQYVTILFFSLFCEGSAVAQSVTLSDSIDAIQNIGTEVYLYEDETRTWTLQDAISNNHLFVKSTKEVPVIGVTKAHIWTRFQMIRKSDDEFQLVMGYPNLDTVFFYYPEQGVYKSKYTSWMQPNSQREVPAALLIFNIPPGQKDTVLTYYIRSEGRIVILPLSVGKSNLVKDAQHQNTLYFLFYLGFVTMLFFYNFSIYFTSREREYLYYSSWVLFVTLFFMIAKGYSSLLLPAQLNGIFRHTNIISSLGGISIVLFVTTTLQLKKYLPSIMKWFYGLLIFYGVIIVSSLLGRLQLASSLSQLVLILTVIIGLIAGAVMYRKGHAFARYYFYGFIITLISMFTYILIFQKVLPFNMYTNNSIVVGSVIEMILFSFGLGAKINTLNREKQAAQASAIKALQEKEQVINEQRELLEIKVNERTHELSVEKKKSDDLLLNILPSEVAAELMANGVCEAKNYANVSVLFTDFVNFTGISEKLTPKQLVDELHICFKSIDEIIEQFGMEKIKTIGDAYLAVSGLPHANENHAQNTVLAAIQIIRFVNERKKTGGLFDIRIGIHSGPVIAGIVGIKKFAFDIWGDTVNTAARLEQNGVQNKINISGTTYNLIKNEFNCTYRGKIEAKNKGEIDMYFVEDSLI